MRLTALAGYFAFVILIANNSSHVHAQSLDITNLENSNYVVALDSGHPQQTIRFGTNVEAPKKTEKQQTYTVKDGDTLVGIAKKFKTTWERLFDKNAKLDNPNLINPGDKIVIPLPNEKLKHRDVEPTENHILNADFKQPQQTPPKPQTATYNPGPSSVSGNSYGYGYCTWYAKTKRPDLPNNLGNADTWASRAAAQGFATGSTPRAGAIGQQGMHVVYIERVNPNGTVTTSEMNYAGWGQVSSRTVPASNFIYIY